eukprot:m51a1_g4299 hypothetical protein (787) ;mRNA; f:2019-7676
MAEDGTSVFEDVRPATQGHTSTASVAVSWSPSGPSAYIHTSALAAAAKIVMHRDRVRNRQRQLEPPGDPDDSEGDEEDEGQSQEGHAASLGAEEMREKAGRAKETAELMQALREDKEALEDIRPSARALHPWVVPYRLSQAVRLPPLAVAVSAPESFLTPQRAAVSDVIDLDDSDCDDVYVVPPPKKAPRPPGPPEAPDDVLVLEQPPEVLVKYGEPRSDDKALAALDACNRCMHVYCFECIDTLLARRTLAIEGPPADECASDWALAMVFSLLPDARALGRCSCVCSRWRRVVEANPRLWARHTLAVTRTGPHLARVPPFVANLDLSALCPEEISLALCNIFRGGVDRSDLRYVHMGLVEPRAFTCIIAHSPCLREIRATIDCMFHPGNSWTSSPPGQFGNVFEHLRLRDAFATRDAKCAATLEALLVCNNVESVPAMPLLRAFSLPGSLSTQFLPLSEAPHALRDVDSLVDGSPLLQHVSFRLYDSSPECVRKVASLRRLTTLGLVDTPQLGLIARCPARRTLRHLGVLSSDVGATLDRVQQLFPQLLALSVFSTAVVDAPAPPAGTQTTVHQGLRRLLVSGPAFRTLAPSACSMPALVSLELCVTMLSGDALAWLCALGALEHLRLKAVVVQPDAMDSLSRSPCGGNLRVLELVDCVLDDPSGEEVEAGQFPLLEKLIVKKCAVTESFVLGITAISPRLWSAVLDLQPPGQFGNMFEHLRLCDPFAVHNAKCAATLEALMVCNSVESVPAMPLLAFSLPGSLLMQFLPLSEAPHVLRDVDSAR